MHTVTIGPWVVQAIDGHKRGVGEAVGPRTLVQLLDAAIKSKARVVEPRGKPTLVDPHQKSEKILSQAESLAPAKPMAAYRSEAPDAGVMLPATPSALLLVASNSSLFLARQSLPCRD